MKHSINIIGIEFFSLFLFSEKLYYDYPAYGSFDHSSFPGSTSSLYPDLAVACRERNSVPIIQTDSRQQIHIPYLSNSAPVVTTMLRDSRQQLFDLHKAETQARDLYSSLQCLNKLDSISQNSLLRELDKPNIGGAEERCYFESYSASSASTSTTYGSPLDHIPENNVNNETTNRTDDVPKTEPKDIDTKNQVDVNKDRADSDKFRILSATPVRNMVSRQVSNLCFQLYFNNKLF